MQYLLMVELGKTKLIQKKPSGGPYEAKSFRKYNTNCQLSMILEYRVPCMLNKC